MAKYTINLFQATQTLAGFELTALERTDILAEAEGARKFEDYLYNQRLTKLDADIETISADEYLQKKALYERVHKTALETIDKQKKAALKANNAKMKRFTDVVPADMWTARAIARQTGNWNQTGIVNIKGKTYKCNMGMMDCWKKTFENLGIQNVTDKAVEKYLRRMMGLDMGSKVSKQAGDHHASEESKADAPRTVLNSILSYMYHGFFEGETTEDGKRILDANGKQVGRTIGGQWKLSITCEKEDEVKVEIVRK